ncbi:methyltransferase domain-containing protein [Actimicrobium sp. CCI2.3]|uniref:methyltransferase domain-containing protein n=1 Tax=Actimicrobium sp. CCI2.3 TaxID=3048616 RepID=UPI002AB38715|nr:methyltransferase domain-containing protein [Actimicrobium sp. CCI2.3]MDY7573489.1 methyltransferase domain-containing protein [Actimicrobium sp. CCI2.3]MEB0022670.1 methyltransferase domain-containing protein [Actimicrobium sp. CCI2.3]
MATPHFTERDPLAPGFWNERFEQQFTPWDQGGVPAELRRFVAQSPTPLTTLIPGCGMGYEVRHLAQAGWPVTAIDFSPAAVAMAQAALGDYAGHVQQADFFSFEPAQTVDFIYERAFLCAMPRARWSAIVAQWAALLAPGALLGGFFFYDDAPKGPPFGADRAALDALMLPYFVLIEEVPVGDSIAVFAGKERWQLWQRR